MSNTSWTPLQPPSERKVARTLDISESKPAHSIHSGTQTKTLPAPLPSSRLITLTHYKKILTTLQVVADAVTVALSFLAGYYLWAVVGPIVAIDIYEPESIYRYYS